jgi:hypothetical protein
MPNAAAPPPLLPRVSPHDKCTGQVKPHKVRYYLNGDELRALVAPGIGKSAPLEDVSEPDPADGAVLVRTVALGVCRTDREIISGEYPQRTLVASHPVLLLRLLLLARGAPA